MKKIINGVVFTPYRQVKDIEISFEGNRIVEIGYNLEGDFEEIIDAKGMYVSPGFIDLHVHGGVGYNFDSDDRNEIENARIKHCEHGATSMCPAAGFGMVVDKNDESIWKQLDVLSDAASVKEGPEIYGIHLEGPVIFASERLTPGQTMDPYDLQFCQKIIDRLKGLAIVTLTPELGNAKKFTKMCIDNGIKVSMGHCIRPTYDQFMECHEAGANMATHIYSSMGGVYREKGKRYPGGVETMLMSDDVYVNVIADTIHLNPQMMDYIYRIKGSEKVFIASDSHFDNGRIKEGEIPAEVMDTPERLFIMTYAPMDFNVNYAYNSTNIPLIDVIKMATINPARALGVADHKGILTEGYDADILIFDENINMKYVVARGKEILKKL